MGRQSSDPSLTIVSSSIALLQERFRQLQKVKERREEQQLIKMISEADHQHQRVVCSTKHFDQPEKLSFQSNIMAPTIRPSPPADSLSLGLNLQIKQVDYFPMKTTYPATPSPSKGFDNTSSDLDTSLHL